MQFSPQTLRSIAGRSDSLVLNSEKFCFLSMVIFIAAMTIKERNVTYMPSAKIGGGGERKESAKGKKEGLLLLSSTPFPFLFLSTPLPLSMPATQAIRH